MFTQGQYEIAFLVLFVLLGAIIYVLDKRFGIALYRWWYNQTHKTPLPPETEMGFVYNRRVKARLTFAALISIGQSVLTIIFGSLNPVWEIMSIIIEPPVLVIGFYLGPFLDSLLGKSEVFLDQIEQVEKGEKTFREFASETSQKAGQKVREAFSGPVAEERSKTGNPAHEEQTAQAEQAEAPVSETKEDTESYIDGFLRREKR